MKTTPLRFTLLCLLVVLPTYASGQDIFSLCDGGSVPHEGEKNRVVYEMAERVLPDQGIAICMTDSSVYRAAGSAAILRPFTLVVLAFNELFFEAAPPHVLRAVVAHELIHQRDNHSCHQFLSESGAYEKCELAVDIKAAALLGIGNCAMLVMLRFLQKFWEEQAPGETPALGTRIGWFEQSTSCENEKK